MTIVSLNEARERLAELIDLMAKGERVVFEDGGKWIASLAVPPPMPQTPEEQAAARAAREQVVEDLLRWRVEQGLAIPEGMTLQEVVDRALGRS